MLNIFVVADVYNICIRTKQSLLQNYIHENIEDFRRLTISFRESSYTNKVDAYLDYYDENEYKLEIYTDPCRAVFSAPWNQINESTIIPMVFRLMVEYLRQSNEEIKMHASCVEKNGIAAIFVAPSEGGKTSTAMRMCQKYGCELISNDATVVKFDKSLFNVLRGDALFKVRANGLEAYLKEMNVNSEIDNKSNTPWFDKKILTTTEMGAKVHCGNAILKYVFFIKLDSLVEKISILKYRSEDDKDKWFKSRMMILQNISGTMRGADLIPTGNSGELLPIYLPSIDDERFSLNRMHFVNQLFEKCEVFQLRGNLGDMSEFINLIMSGDENGD